MATDEELQQVAETAFAGVLMGFEMVGADAEQRYSVCMALASMLAEQVTKDTSAHMAMQSFIHVLEGIAATDPRITFKSVQMTEPRPVTPRPGGFDA